MFPKCVIHPCLLENNQNFTNKLQIQDINIVKSKLSPILKSSMLLSPRVRSSLLLSSIKHVIHGDTQYPISEQATKITKIYTNESSLYIME